MHDDIEALMIAVATTCFILLLIILFIGIISLNDPYKEKLNTCAKQHNVYECELIAVPKKGNK